MTVADAIEEVQTVGSIRAEGGKLRLRFPEPEGARLQCAIETLRRNRDAALAVLTAPESGTVPPVEAWPGSLHELAMEHGKQTGDIETAREEIWISYCEWMARELNRLFKEQGVTGEKGRITAETVWHGEQCRKSRLQY